MVKIVSARIGIGHEPRTELIGTQASKATRSYPAENHKDRCEPAPVAVPPILRRQGQERLRQLFFTSVRRSGT
jgi:hypothetical protein